MSTEETTDSSKSEEEKLYEKMFAYRFTSEDADFQDYITKSSNQYPCVAGYFTKNRNTCYRNERGRGGQRGHWDNRGRGGHWQNRGHDRDSRYGQGRDGHYGQGRDRDGYHRDQRQNYGNGGYNRHSGDRNSW